MAISIVIEISLFIGHGSRKIKKITPPFRTPGLTVALGPVEPGPALSPRFRGFGHCQAFQRKRPTTVPAAKLQSWPTKTKFERCRVLFSPANSPKLLMMWETMCVTCSACFWTIFNTLKMLIKNPVAPLNHAHLRMSSRLLSVGCSGVIRCAGCRHGEKRKDRAVCRFPPFGRV